MQIAIIDYNAGNIQSVKLALERLGVHVIISREKEAIKKADKIIFPGQGEASNAMFHLKKYHLDTLIPTLTQPFLGICIGQQLMCSHSEEGNTNCLNIFADKVCKFAPSTSIKVPQVGWNTLQNMKGPLFKKIPIDAYVYFVHSYYVPLSKYTIATSRYPHSFSAALQKENFMSVQFHPEKSGSIGHQILKNFIEL